MWVWGLTIFFHFFHHCWSLWGSLHLFESVFMFYIFLEKYFLEKFIYLQNIECFQFLNLLVILFSYSMHCIFHLSIFSTSSFSRNKSFDLFVNYILSFLFIPDYIILSLHFQFFSLSYCSLSWMKFSGYFYLSFSNKIITGKISQTYFVWIMFGFFFPSLCPVFFPVYSRSLVNFYYQSLSLIFVSTTKDMIEILNSDIIILFYHWRASPMEMF